MAQSAIHMADPYTCMLMDAHGHMDEVDNDDGDDAAAARRHRWIPKQLVFRNGKAK